MIERPNLRILGIKEEAEAQSKSMENQFNEVITENSPSLRTSTGSCNAIPGYISKIII
jgi:hypothetical protein